MSATPKRCVLGTRGSALALAQARWVARQLEAKTPGLQVEISVIKTLGDWEAGAALKDLGSKGIFTKEIEEALLAGRIDLAVHSLKDLPVELPQGLVLGAVPKREDPRDALVSRGNLGLDALPQQARLGTGSLRRKGQILIRRPDLKVQELRGNVQTRMRRVEDGDLDAVVLAHAGLARLGLVQHIAESFEPETVLPAVGQGALGLEIRAGDEATMGLLKAIDDAVSKACVVAERAFLGALGGGCRVPIGALARLQGKDKLVLHGGVFCPDGKEHYREAVQGPAAQAEALGKTLADTLLARGAQRLLTHG